MKKKFEWFTTLPVIINFPISKIISKHKVCVSNDTGIKLNSIIVNTRNTGVYKVVALSNKRLELETISKHKRSVGHKKFDVGDVCFVPVELKRKIKL